MLITIAKRWVMLPDIEGPCPIPRCALEVYLAVQMLVIGALLAILPEQNTVAAALGFDHVEMNKYQWGAFVACPGLAQILALSVPQRIVHRWAAFACMCVSAAMALILINAPILTISAGLFSVLTVSEAYVFLMLRGARWNSLSNSSTISQSNGSSALR